MGGRNVQHYWVYSMQARNHDSSDILALKIAGGGHALRKGNALRWSLLTIAKRLHPGQHSLPMWATGEGGGPCWMDKSCIAIHPLLSTIMQLWYKGNPKNTLLKIHLIIWHGTEKENLTTLQYLNRKPEKIRIWRTEVFENLFWNELVTL